MEMETEWAQHIYIFHQMMPQENISDLLSEEKNVPKDKEKFFEVQIFKLWHHEVVFYVHFIRNNENIYSR